MSSLLSLPDELLSSLATSLGPEHILNFACANKRLLSCSSASLHEHRRLHNRYRLQYSYLTTCMLTAATLRLASLNPDVAWHIRRYMVGDGTLGDFAVLLLLPRLKSLKVHGAGFFGDNSFNWRWGKCLSNLEELDTSVGSGSHVNLLKACKALKSFKSDWSFPIDVLLEHFKETLKTLDIRRKAAVEELGTRLPEFSNLRYLAISDGAFLTSHERKPEGKDGPFQRPANGPSTEIPGPWYHGSQKPVVLSWLKWVDITKCLPMSIETLRIYSANCVPVRHGEIARASRKCLAKRLQKVVEVKAMQFQTLNSICCIFFRDDEIVPGTEAKADAMLGSLRATCKQSAVHLHDTYFQRRCCSTCDDRYEELKWPKAPEILDRRSFKQSDLDEITNHIPGWKYEDMSEETLDNIARDLLEKYHGVDKVKSEDGEGDLAVGR